MTRIKQNYVPIDFNQPVSTSSRFKKNCMMRCITG